MFCGNLKSLFKQNMFHGTNALGFLEYFNSLFQTFLRLSAILKLEKALETRLLTCTCKRMMVVRGSKIAIYTCLSLLYVAGSN